MPDPGDETRSQAADAAHAATTTAALSAVGPANPDRLNPWPEVPGFEILGVLGRGGMGIVYRAREHGLNRVVALKMVLSGAHARSDELIRFLSEAETAAKLQHHGIVQIFGSGRVGGLPYFVMELVDGGSLADRIQTAPLPPAEAAAMVRRLAEAVEYAHAAGVIHRDLKPANILLTADGSPKVTDFGLARRLESGDGLTRTGAVVGTPSYMPPEQARGDLKSVGPGGDVYSLGAILFSCLTGRPPFRGVTPSDTISQVISAPPPRPQSVNGDVPRDLETITLKCLEKEPNRRYAAAADLAADLRRFLEGRPVAARRVGPLARGWRWAKRNPAVASLLAAVFASLAVGAGVAVYLAAQWAAAAAVARGEAEEADRQKNGAERARAEAQAQVVRLDLATARMYADRGEHPAGLFWAARAWRDDLAHRPLDVVAESQHRLRVGSVLDELPELAGLCLHDKPILDADMAPDGKRVLILDGGPAAGVWHADRCEVSSALVHGGPVACGVFSTDGSRIATASADGTANVWDAATGALRFTLPHAGPAAWVGFSTKGDRIVTAAGRKVQVWDTGGKPTTVAFEAAAAVDYTAFSPDGRRIVTASVDGTARVWDAATGKPVSDPLPQPRMTPVPGWDEDQRALERRRHRPAFSPDSASVVTTDDLGFHLWSAGGTTRVQLFKTPPERPVQTEAAFTPDGEAVIFLFRPGTQVERYLIKAKTWDASPPGLPRQTAIVRVRPDGQSAAAAVTNGTVYALAMPDRGRTGSTMVSAKAISAMRYTPDGTRLMVASLDGTVRVWGTPGSRPRAKYAFDCGRADKLEVPNRAFTPDGKTSAGTVPGGVSVGPRGVAAGRTVLPQPNGVPLLFSPDGKTLVTVGQGNLELWDPAAGKELFAIPLAAAPAFDADFSGDGRRLALRTDPVVAGGPSRLEVWDLTTATRVFSADVRIDTNPYRTPMAVNFDGTKVVVPDVEDLLHPFDIGDGKALPKINLKRSAYINGADFARSHGRLAVAASDLSLRQFDPATGHQAGPTVLCKAVPVAVAWANEDRWLLAVTEDHRIVIAEAETGDELASLGPFPFFIDGMPTDIAGRKFRVWLSTDGRTAVAHCPSSGFVTAWPLPAYRAAADALGPLTQLLTGKRMDPAGHLDAVDPDEWRMNPAPYRRAYRIWKGHEQ